jgi:hypothetical protein
MWQKSRAAAAYFVSKKWVRQHRLTLIQTPQALLNAKVYFKMESQ